MGEAYAGIPLADWTSGFVPVWLDAGVRLSRRWYVGIYGQYGRVDTFPPYPGPVTVAGLFGPDFIARAGLADQFHPREAGFIDPWVGLGVGYEFREHTGGGELHPQLGIDVHFGEWLSIGPFLSCSFGRYALGLMLLPGRTLEYTPPPHEPAVHQWVAAGIRGVFDL